MHNDTDDKIDFWLKHLVVAVREHAAAKHGNNAVLAEYWAKEFMGITQVLAILESIKERDESFTNQRGA